MVDSTYQEVHRTFRSAAGWTTVQCDSSATFAPGQQISGCSNGWHVQFIICHKKFITFYLFRVASYIQSHEMYAMRDPIYVDQQEELLLTWASVSWASCPSLSGIAFAAVAASLPLLAAKSLGISTCKSFLNTGQRRSCLPHAYCRVQMYMN